MWYIYDNKGEIRAEVHELEYEGIDGGARTVTCSINSPTPIKWNVTDSLNYRGETFYLRHIPSEKKQARIGTREEAFAYNDIAFYSAIDELTSCDFLDVTKEDNNLHYSALPIFSFYCETIYDIADRLQANLDRLYTGVNKWTIQVNPDPSAKTSIKPQSLSFSSEKCSNVLERIYNDLGVTYEHHNRTITFGAMPIVMPYEFQYGKGKGLKSIEQSGADDNALVTRARVYGSTRNLPHRYYNKLYKNKYTGKVMYFKKEEDKPDNFEESWQPLISETMYVPNLMLPMFRENGKDAYIDAPDAIAKYGLREGTKFFDSDNGEDEEIYPTIENMTADRLIELGYTPNLPENDNGNLDEIALVQEITHNGVIEEGENLKAEDSYFYVWLKDIGFDINDHLSASGTAKISFKSGALAGREFEIAKCEEQNLLYKQYKLTCKRVEDTTIQLVFPNAMYQPAVGDKFVLLEIDMPEIYIKVAELRLKEEGEKWLELNSNPIYTYTPEIDPINILRNPKIAENLKEGRTLIFSDEDLGITKTKRISNLKIKDNGVVPEYEVTLSEKHSTSLAEKVTQNVVNMIGANNVSVNNIKSLIDAYGNNLFLNKKKRDTADQVIRFAQGLEVGEGKATIDADGAIKSQEVISNNIHTTDFAQGALLGTGGAIYQLNGATYAEFDYLTARKGATFAELIIQEYRSIGGALVISQANGEIERIYDYGNGYNIWLKDDDRVDSLFANKDLVRCQYWDKTKNELVYYWTPVSVSEDLQGRYALTIYKKDMNGVVPQVGDKLVQMGNTTDTSRQGCILLTTENSLPRMAILDGINSTTLSNTNYKGIYGSLDGFTDPTTNKALSGYGMWGENVHLHGDLILSSTNKSVSDSLKDVGNGRNLLLGTNRGVENWKFNSSLPSTSNNPYTMLEIDYNGAKGMQMLNRTNGTATYEVFYYPLRPQFIKKGKTYHLSFDMMQSINHDGGIEFKASLSTTVGGEQLTNIVNVVSKDINGLWMHYDVEFTAIADGSTTSKQVVYFNINADSRYWNDFAIANLKLEEGVKATEWTSAPEDAQDEYDHLAELANNAQTTADTAEEAAEEAKSNAYLAQLSANEAKERLDAWAEDGVISPNEKQGLKDELARIEGDYNDITDRFDRASLDSPSYYIEAYNAYTDMLSYLINESAISGKETTDIPEDFAEIQENYYQQKVNAYYDLYDSSLASAENAQSMADAIAQTTATLTQDIININNRLDGVVENWFYKGYPTPQNAPAIEWTNAQEKYNHIGDTFTSIDENGDYAGKSWRWIGVTAEPSFEIDFTTGSINGVTYYFYWQTIADSDAIKALQQAKNAQDTADGKRRVFVAQPTTPYDEGDLWVKTENNGVTTIYYCVTPKADGNGFDGNDWELASTDDSALQAFINGNFKEKISNLQTQIDGKAETWYQESDPSKSWITDDLKELHTGDMWYKTTTNTTYRWNGSSWDEQNIPKSVFDTIDGKAQIFVSTPTPPYYIGDLWVQGEDGDIMRCMTSRVDGMYNPNDWKKASKYTDDTELNAYMVEVGKEFQVTDGKFESIQYKVEGSSSARNLLLKSNEGLQTKNYFMGSYYLGNSKPQKGDVVTLSFTANVFDDRITRFRVFNSGGTLPLQNNISIKEYRKDIKISSTFTWNINDDGNTHINIYQTNDDFERLDDLYGNTIIKNIKLEFGDVATEWSIAPEESNAYTESRIKQTADNIELKVKNGLAETGIDIENKKITVTADNFTIKNNNDKIVASADKFGNWSTNTLITLNDDGTKAITINEEGNRILTHYYPYTNQRQLEEGWNGTSLFRYFDENGVMLWQLGGAKGFMDADYIEWTAVGLYKTGFNFGVEHFESNKKRFTSIGDVELSAYYQHNVINATPKMYETQSTNNPLNGWFTNQISWQPFDSYPEGFEVRIWKRIFIHYTNGVENFRNSLKWDMDENEVTIV